MILSGLRAGGDDRLAGAAPVLDASEKGVEISGIADRDQGALNQGGAHQFGAGEMNRAPFAPASQTPSACHRHRHRPVRHGPLRHPPGGRAPRPPARRGGHERAPRRRLYRHGLPGLFRDWHRASGPYVGFRGRHRRLPSLRAGEYQTQWRTMPRRTKDMVSHPSFARLAAYANVTRRNMTAALDDPRCPARSPGSNPGIGT